jgi:SAM-dependent methyltransferase/uncharacterized protein YbaR (Trm112 family)
MNGTVAIPRGRPASGLLSELTLCCPVCRGEMEAFITAIEPAPDQLVCDACGSDLLLRDGIWRAIPAGRFARLAGPLSNYEEVRKAEGRWSTHAEFYLSLPWKDTTKQFSAQWRIRAHSFRYMTKNLLPLCARGLGKRYLRILDLGAGNCWMSYQLSLLGHLPVAVDLSTSEFDGLGAARHYRAVSGITFPCFQAEMDRLPFAVSQFDAAIFNASFHYARDYEATLSETLRVLRPGGSILIMDSPTYRNEADGEAMRRDKSDEYLRRYGSDSGNMGGQEYLTPERLARLEKFGIRWRRYTPWRGWRWALRPFFARISGRRRPSQFHLYLGTLTPERMEAQ